VQGAPGGRRARVRSEAVADHAGLERFALMSAPTTGAIAIAHAAGHPERVSRRPERRRQR